MAVGLPDPPAALPPRPADWTELFRGFQTALDPRKLLVAAAGVLVMSLGWYALSAAFNRDRPLPNDPAYQPAQVGQELVSKKKPNGEPYAEPDYEIEARRRYERDLAEWQVLDGLAGKNGGRLRTLPWDEYRGPNPFLLFTRFVSGSSVGLENAFRDFAAGTVPVLIEPFRKLLLPLVKLLDPNASFLTRVYLVLCLAWSVAVWAFAGGVITRLAAVGLAGKDRITLKEAVRFVARRYLNYVLSPLVPVGIIAFIVLVMALYGLVALIPLVGDVILYGLLYPLVLLGGIVMAILVVGLVGYPLMYPTVSAEGSDTFDALSRSYNYVFQAPWSFLWYNVVALLYGAVVVLFVVFVASLMAYLGKFAVSQAPLSETTNRKPDYLFVYAPESFGWKQLLLDGSPAAITDAPTPPPGVEARRHEYVDVNPDVAKQYRDNIWGVERAGAAMVGFWLTLAMLFVIGFSYSYFWSSATIIYLLMRRKVDETELDEVYVEEALPEPTLPPAGPMIPAPAPPGGMNLPTVPAAPPAPGYSAPPSTFASPTYAPPVEPLPPLPMSPPPPTTYTPPVPPAGSAPVVSTPSAGPVPMLVPPNSTTTVSVDSGTSSPDLPDLPQDDLARQSPPLSGGVLPLPPVSPPPVTTPTTEPALFPPPTDDLKHGGEFKKDTDSL